MGDKNNENKSNRIDYQLSACTNHGRVAEFDVLAFAYIISVHKFINQK